MWGIDNYMKNLCRACVAVMAMLIVSCAQKVPPVLGELMIDSVTSDKVCCHVEVNGEGILDVAFNYATTKSAAEKNHASKVQGTYDVTTINGEIGGLKPNTTYYIRAYAMNSYGRTYTEIVSVKTMPQIPAMDDNEHPTVDR